jgi:hypothetical protein
MKRHPVLASSAASTRRPVEVLDGSAHLAGPGHRDEPGGVRRRQLHASICRVSSRLDPTDRTIAADDQQQHGSTVLLVDVTSTGATDGDCLWAGLDAEFGTGGDHRRPVGVDCGDDLHDPTKNGSSSGRDA